MTQIMDPDVLEPRARPHGPPGVSEVLQVRTQLPAGDDPGIPLDAW